LRNENHQPAGEREHDEPVPFQRLSGHQVNDHGKYQTAERLQQTGTVTAGGSHRTRDGEERSRTYRDGNVQYVGSDVVRLQRVPSVKMFFRQYRDLGGNLAEHISTW